MRCICCPLSVVSHGPPGSLHPSLCVPRTASPSQLSFTALPAGPPAQRRPRGLFSTVPSEAVFNTALVRLLQHYRWTRVGLLTQEGARPSQEGARLSQVRPPRPDHALRPPGTLTLQKEQRLDSDTNG